jgi:Spy/CpxP family protein refolding chaperone
MRPITLALMTLCFASLPAAARAQEEPGAVPASPPMLDTVAFKDLGLTADQRAKIQAIHEQARKDNEPLRKQVHEILGGRRFQDLTPAERDSLRPKLDPIRRQMMDNVRRVREQVTAVLTPEQRLKLSGARRERRRARGSRDSS